MAVSVCQNGCFFHACNGLRDNVLRRRTEQVLTIEAEHAYTNLIDDRADGSQDAGSTHRQPRLAGDEAKCVFPVAGMPDEDALPEGG